MSNFIDGTIKGISGGTIIADYKVHDAAVGFGTFPEATPHTSGAGPRHLGPVSDAGVEDFPGEGDIGAGDTTVLFEFGPPQIIGVCDRVF